MFVLFSKGGPLMWPILFCSILSLGIIIEKIYIFYKNKYLLKISINDFFEKTDFPGGMAKDIIEALKNINNGKNINEKQIYSRANDFISYIERRLNWLGIIANVTPIIGLLGTVTGMIKVFMVIQNSQGQVNPSILAGGIWEALLTTAFGLMVSLPSLVAYHIFQDMVDDYQKKLEQFITLIMDNKK